MVLASEKVRSYLDGKEIKKLIVVPGKLVNLVVK
jgi:leucyl-tRNA synthetase